MSALSREVLATALQEAWNDFCSDTGNFPDCFKWRGRKLYADFTMGNFVSHVLARLEAAPDTAEELPTLRKLEGWVYLQGEGALKDGPAQFQRSQWMDLMGAMLAKEGVTHHDIYIDDIPRPIGDAGGGT